MRKFLMVALMLLVMFVKIPETSATSVYNWKYVQNKWYYMDSSGATYKGWLKWNNSWYYLEATGTMKTGWLYWNGTWYYLNPSGDMKTGWVYYNQNWYFLDASGSMKTGWVKDGEQWFYLDNTGAMKTGWLTWFGKEYYLQPNGAMKTGIWDTDSKTYFFSEQGDLIKTSLKGWVTEGTKKYYYGSNGVALTGLQRIDNQYYYFNNVGEMVTGWVQLEGEYSYFGQNGVRSQGFIFDGSHYYYLDANGSPITGWVTQGSKSYYFDSTGAAKVGWHQEGNRTYYLSENGESQLHWVNDGGSWYYINDNQTLHTGWMEYEGNWYYFFLNGKMATGWVLVDSKWYYMNVHGQMQTGWLLYEEHWYFLLINGEMATGNQTVDGKTYVFSPAGIWLPGPFYTYTDYSSTFAEVVSKQLAVNPQTDLYRNDKAYVSSTWITVNPADPTEGTVNTSVLNVRAGAGSDYHIFGTLTLGSVVKINAVLDGWYEIKYKTWRNAKAEDISYYLNPNNFSQNSNEYFQFLVLSKSAGADVNEINNNILASKGILTGKGQAFIDASRKFSINELYLISHALLETGNGTHSLATGVLVSSVNGVEVEPKTVYNMYGINAKDSCPTTCGSEYAYQMGWFSPEAAIIGGAEFIAKSYINSPTYKQDTLYKMRWNPANPATHQYATDIGWAVKQVNNISNLYKQLSSYTLYFDIPRYK